MANKFLMRAVAAVVSTLAAASACAEAVSADSAGVAAKRWLRDDAALGCALGSEVEAVRTCSPQSDASFHVVMLKGGGFVVMSSDTTREPVVAFSSGGELVESDANPLWVLLKSDLAIRTAESGGSSAKAGLLRASAASSANFENEAKWDRLLGKTTSLLRSMQGVSAVSDVRVAPLVQSRWSQEDVGGSPCYNYYTPSNYVCGCVATAGAQIMRYFEWPRSSASVAQFTNPHCEVDGVARTLTTQGGSCNWSQMPLVPSGSITDAQRRSIGKLTSDIGICVGMSYTDEGSSAGGYMLAEVFTNHYGYANALAACWGSDISSSADTKNALLSNFDAGLPVAIGLSGAGGHEVVGDGYGYSGDTLYIHLNMGWGGYDDAWYAPPSFGTSQFDFSMMTEFVCNVFTNSADKGGVICSGRVLDSTGSPIENATVSASIYNIVKASATTNAKGIYALVLKGLSSSHSTTYTLKATSSGSTATASVTLGANVGTGIITSGQGFGRYYSGKVTIGNRCGQDITISGISGVDEPQFNPASCLFYPSTNVTLACATAGATIRYTTDGTDPTESSPEYTGPISIASSTVISARAWKDGLNPSAIVVGRYTYAPKGDYFAAPISISGPSGSYVIDDNAEYSEEPDEPQHTDTWYDETDNCWYRNYELKTVWYKWDAPGSGTMTFRTYCSDSSYVYPTYIAIYAGDALSSIQRIAVSTALDSNWATSLSLPVEQGATYRIVGMIGYDASGTFTLSWSGDLTTGQTATSTTDVAVPYAWLDGYFPGQGSGAQEYEALAGADSDGDGIANWAEYLLGTDPTNSLSKLEVTIRMDGSTPIVESNADAARLAEFGYQPVLKGKQQLDTAADWAPTNLLHRFFKIFVEKQ